jgi:hypothetical protein
MWHPIAVLAGRLSLLAACSLLDVRKVNAPTPSPDGGVRYTLSRPAWQVLTVHTA